MQSTSQERQSLIYHNLSNQSAYSLKSQQHHKSIRQVNQSQLRNSSQASWLNRSRRYIYKQYQSIIRHMGKKTTHPNYQRINNLQLQKYSQTMARLDTLQMALAEAITQNQALRERVIELEALLVAVQMKEEGRQLKNKRQSEEEAKKDTRKKKVQKNKKYK